MIFKRSVFNTIGFSVFNLVFNLVIVLGFLVNIGLSKVLTNSYLIEFNRDTDRTLADQIALRNGFINRGPVSASCFLCFFILNFFKRYNYILPLQTRFN